MLPQAEAHRFYLFVVISDSWNFLKCIGLYMMLRSLGDNRVDIRVPFWFFILSSMTSR